MKNKKIIFVVLLSFIVDRITKLLVTNLIPDSKQITIINNFFYLTNVKNTGAAFSILEGNIILLAIIGIAILGILIYYLIKEKDSSHLTKISYSMIIGGIIGNLVDRLFLGGVIDFISIKIVNYFFPIFNIADSLIVIGIMILIIESVKESDLFNNN